MPPLTIGRPAPGPNDDVLATYLQDFQKDPIAFFVRLHREYGDVARIQAGPELWHLVAHPDGVRRILAENYQDYGKCGGMYLMLRAVMGQGLLTSEGDAHRRQRRILQPAFHRAALARIHETMTAAAERMLARWQDYVDTERTLDVADEMLNVTLDISGRALVGVPVDEIRARDGTSLRAILDNVFQRASHPLRESTLDDPSGDAATRALATFDDITYAMIERRRREPADHSDILSLLLLASDAAGEALSDRQIRDELLTLFITGSETNSLALVWLWCLLARHAEVEARVRSEALRVLGGRPPTFDALRELEYAGRVIDEVLRLYPPAWGVERVALRDDEILGYHIPAGSSVMVSSFVTHRHPAFWDHPQQFDPEHFRADRAQARHRFAYFPFGAGPHKCIGNHFALMQARIVLTTLIQRYRLRLAPETVLDVEPSVPLRPRQKIEMRLEAWPPG